jgi:hypothetical protein
VHIRAIMDDMDGVAKPITPLGKQHHNWVRQRGLPFEAEWLDGATGPALGARFRGHLKRNEIGPVYWTTCRVTACEPGREFGFQVLLGGRPVNNWCYEFTSTTNGTDVTESFWLNDSAMPRIIRFLGEPRRRRNIRDMTKTLERIKTVVEATDTA